MWLLKMHFVVCFFFMNIFNKYYSYVIRVSNTIRWLKKIDKIKISIIQVKGNERDRKFANLKFIPLIKLSSTLHNYQNK